MSYSGQYSKIEVMDPYDYGSETDEDLIEEKTTLAEWQDDIRRDLRRVDLPFIDFSTDEEEEESQKAYVRNCMNYGGSFTVGSESSQRRYTIVFPRDAPPLTMNDVPCLPYCSCRAYEFKSFDSKNEYAMKGGCKHLYDVIEFGGRSMDEYDWNFRLTLANDPWSIKN